MTRQICYFYIFEYKSLSDVGFVVDSHYDFSFDKKERILTINKNTSLPEHFWSVDDSIYSLSAIVGDNGAGKSTAFCFLMEALVEGRKTENLHGFFIWKQGDKLYCNNLLNFQGNQPCEYAKGPQPIETFYYSGHYLPNVDLRDPRCYKMKGEYLATDSWLLVEDLQDYTNLDTHLLNRSLRHHLASFIAQNNHRICRMLSDCALQGSLEEYCLPEYVILGVNSSAVTAIRLDPKPAQNLIKLISDFNSLSFKNSKDKLQALFLFNNLMSAAVEGSNIITNNICRFISRWLNIINTPGTILDNFKTLLSKTDATEYGPYDCSSIKAIYESINTFFNLAHFAEDKMGNPFLYLSVKDDSEILASISASLVDSYFTIVSRYTDLHYSRSLDNINCILSSGEQKFLDLFSRLHDAFFPIPANIHPPSLILLDEAEIGFHPEWQRKFISILTEFLSKVSKVSPPPEYQIVISTHSPVLLSDIPSCCVNYLKRNDEGKTVNVLQNEETFATNVFDLYRSAFFMQNGLVGAFAQKRIKSLERRIDSRNYDREEILQEIELIGDPRIRSYLLEKMAARVEGYDLIQYYERQIAKLKSAKKHGND